MRTLTGVVSTRHGIASERLQGYLRLIADRVKVPPLVPGTLNVQLAEPYIVIADAEILPSEYDGIETLKLQRCRVRGLRCCIMRPDRHETPDNPGGAVLEIMSEYRLRDVFALVDGDRLDVEVEGDDRWWEGA